MKLSQRTIPRLAELICGSSGSANGFHHLNFKYRSSWYLTQFFKEDCRLPFEHDGSTRVSWVTEVLQEINNGNASYLELPADDMITVISELLTSIELDMPDNHQGALEDINRILAKDNLKVEHDRGLHTITRIDRLINKTIHPIELKKALEDYANHVTNEIRMTFWKHDRADKKYKWISSPEQHAQKHLLTFLNGRFGNSVYTFEEINAGAGRIDVYIALPKGEKIIVELKMSGHNYSSAYAREGLEQIAHYMENKHTDIGYLIVFDSRVRDFRKGFSEIENINGHQILVEIADLRPYVKLHEAPSDV